MSTAAKVGAFFVLALFFAGLMIWRIEGLRFGGPAARKISVEFKDVAGLEPKSVVRLAGVRVGTVSKISLGKNGHAIVDLAIDKDVELKRGSSATIANLGLLGDKYVELVPGPEGAPMLPEGSTISGEVPVGFDQITRLASEIEVDVKDITKNLKESLGGPEGEERLRTIVENVRLLTEDLRLMVASNRGNVDATVANFRDFSAAITKLAERMDRLVESNQANVTQGVANVRVLTEKLETMADNLNKITGRIAEGEGTVGKLIQSEETHKNLNDTLVAVKEGIGGLNKTLGSIGRTKFDLGLRGEYLSRFSQGKAYFSMDIIPPETPRFYRLEIASQPFGLREDTTKTEKTTFPDGHTETTVTEEEKLKDDFAISAMFGYRWNAFALRAGVLESRGGAGIDYQLLKNRMRLSADVWDFNRNGYSAHGKLTGRLFFSPSVYLTGGWDDLLNHSKGADSVFFGAGVRWGDDDLKYLLGSLPIRR